MKEYVHTSGDEVAYANVNEAIETTLTLTKSEYKHVAEIAQEFGEIPAVRCSVNELNQILVNLIVNAIDAIGEVVAKTGAKGTIKICTWVDAKGVVFSIADTGCGIAKAHQSQVFDPFFTTKEVGKGTGQGLSLVWNLVVEKYLGEVWFESQEGHGTTFYVRLPRAVAAAA
jgi:signal transduction histidine kinase